MKLALLLFALSAPASADDPRQLLEKLVGDWQVRIHVVTPDGKLSDDAGRCERRAILGGRFIEGTHRASFFGQAFEEKVLLGYDEQKRKFVSVTADNTRSGFVISEGTVDQHGNLTYFGEERDDAGRPRRFRYVVRFFGPDKHVIEAWNEALGKKVGEVVYTRR